MRLVLYMQTFVADLTADMEASAIKAGKLHTLQALRAITDRKAKMRN
jgi:hypothetical protein